MHGRQGSGVLDWLGHILAYGVARGVEACAAFTFRVFMAAQLTTRTGFSRAAKQACITSPSTGSRETTEPTPWQRQDLLSPAWLEGGAGHFSLTLGVTTVINSCPMCAAAGTTRHGSAQRCAAFASWRQQY